MSLKPADGYRNQFVRIPDLAVTDDVLRDLTFENCTIVGPAVLALLESTTISGCTWDGPFDAFAWPIPEGRPWVIGAIGLVNVSFYGCRFQRIGLAFPESQNAAIRAGFS